MSAAVLFFWDWANAPAAPPPPPPAPAPGTLASPTSAGAALTTANKIGQAQGKLKIDGRTIEYDPFTREHWDVREAYLRSLAPPEPIQPAPPPDNVALEYERRANEAYERRKAELESLAAERAHCVDCLRAATSLTELKQQGERIAEINEKIVELTGAQAVHRFLH